MFDPGDIISTYTRAQAIEDGTLIDVSETAREAGIRFPVAVTQAVWADIITPDDRSRPYGQSEEGRLWDVVWMLRHAIRRAQPGQSVIRFSLYVIMKARQRRFIELKAVCGPGDNGEPVITVMLPNED